MGNSLLSTTAFYVAERKLVWSVIRLVEAVHERPVPDRDAIVLW